MTTQISFGTSGWRAVMAEKFTFATVRRAVHGIARYVALCWKRARGFQSGITYRKEMECCPAAVLRDGGAAGQIAGETIA